MQRNFTRLLLSAVLMMCCTMMYAEIELSKPQTDGNGNYELSTAAELYWFANYVNSGNTSANAILTEDITVNESVLDSNGDLASGTFETWTPIGNSSKLYAGTFNGNGHTISGLYFNDGNVNNVGLFGKTASGAYIHDLGISDSYFLGHNHVGGICGDFAYGRIENCWNGATIVGTDYDAGGISGSCWLYAFIANCYNVGNVSLSKEDNLNRFAGICGSVYSTTTADYTIDNCYTLDSKCNKIHGFLVDGCPETKINHSFVKDKDAFKSGEVCWLLNNGVTDGSQKWFQTLEEDDTPSLSTSRGIIFKITDDQGECEYANAECQHEQTYKSYQAAVCPTATTTGRYEYWHCSHCSTDFMDESCTIEATEENLTVSVATNKEIWYTTTDNKKLTPNNKDVFGATYDDANNVYEKGLGKITFNTDITSFGNNAFYNCSGLTSIEIPNSVTSIGNNAFRNCSDLTSVTIGNSVTSIGDNAFNGCSGLTSIEIPNSVTSIGDDAFRNCSGLTSIEIPNSVTSIGDNAFYNCSDLTSVTIGNSVTSIGNYTFYGCGGLTSVTIGNSVTSIGNNAFDGCSGLTSVTIGNSVTSIGDYTFYQCSNLTSITIPNSVTSIGYSAFYECKKLSSVVIPNGVTSIGDIAFDGCSGLTSVTIGNSVTSIGDNAFYNCSGLTSVIFYSLPDLGKNAFIFCDNLKTMILDLTDSDKPYIGTSTSNYPDFTEARYHRTLEQGKWGTIVLPFKPSSTEGLKFYALQSMTLRQAQGESGNDGSLVFTKVDAPETGIPYLFRNEGESADFTLTAETPSSIILETQEIGPDNFKMKGCFQSVQLNGVTNNNLYYLKDNEFYHANSKINIAPFRAYIEGNEGNGAAQAKSFMLVVSDNGDDVTAVPGILNGDGSIDETEGIYDINGHRLFVPRKGQVNIIRTKSGKTIKRMF